LLGIASRERKGTETDPSAEGGRKALATVLASPEAQIG
jgi:hypothetical protein